MPRVRTGSEGHLRSRTATTAVPQPETHPISAGECNDDKLLSMVMPDDNVTSWLSVEGANIVDRLLARLLGIDDRMESRASQIALELARQIIEGQIGAGADLNSMDLAKRFGTSRTPVREALVLLENEELIETPPRRRPRAALLPRETVYEIYLLRAELYAIVARRLVEHASDEKIAALEQFLDQMRDAAKVGGDDYFWRTVLFHEQAAAATGDLTLKRTIDSLGLRVLQLRHLGMGRGWQVDLSLRGHEYLMIALKHRDAELAAAVNRSLVTQPLEGLMNIYSDPE
ncbi:MAG: GntR family transcriptional regulator [Comamonadaceae bacterium]|nr:MAG: GntR family transcriptional regulator [Comamonadaceae bacterium]